MVYHVVNNDSKDGLPRRNDRIGFTLAEGATHVDKLNNVRKIAFTMAEVLITLGIIGVVAALTLSSFITKYKRHELENRFKKASALVESALNRTVSELALEDCAHPVENSCNAAVTDVIRAEANDVFAQQFKIIKYPKIIAGAPGDSFTTKVLAQKAYSYSGTLKSFLNGTVGGYNTGYNYTVAYVLQDGTYISTICFQHHGVMDGLKVVFDTNGPFKGPNRYGYDIFIYDSGYWNASDCGGQHDYGCYKYAQADENPEDKTKGYWDSLKF